MYPNYNCGACARVLQKTNGHIEPDCWHHTCRAPQLMQETFEPWLVLFYLLRSEMLSSAGLGAYVLRRAKLMDEDSLILLASMEGAHNKAICEKK